MIDFLVKKRSPGCAISRTTMYAKKIAHESIIIIAHLRADCKGVMQNG